jgi:hypothetical protein
MAVCGWIYIRNSPKDSKHVSEVELEEIGNLDKTVRDSAGKANFSGLLKTPLVWWCFVTLFIFSIVPGYVN